MTHPNPLLSESFRIPFGQIRAEHVVPGVEEVLKLANERIDALTQDPAEPTFDNVLTALDNVTRWVSERIGPVGHLLSVAESPELRAAYNEVIPALSTFSTRLPLNAELWARLKAFSETAEAARLEGVQKRHLEKTLEEFRRAGADLPSESRTRLEELKLELAQLTQKFGENVLDATASWEWLVEEERQIDGMPPAAKARARAKAEAKELEGWLLTLDYPSVEPVLKYVDDQETRKTVHGAFSSRCNGDEWDNRPLILNILRLRHELAQLLGYDDFPDYRLVDHMAGSGAAAIEFEKGMAERTRPYWQQDHKVLSAHGKLLGIESLMPWDVGYVAESLRKTSFDLDDEMLRPYFELDRVMKGLFHVVERVFGVTVEEQTIEEVWHPDVRYYRLSDVDGIQLGAFYTDWYPRKEKRQGAWMNDFVTGGPMDDGSFAPHLGVICGNFPAPEGDNPSLLNHREVQTIFHEFGHLLHHATSRVPIPSRSGIHVAWDFVELPSQFLENWTWEREALDLFAVHHETGEALPEELFQRMMRARRFLGGWGQMRQLSLGTVDLALHHDFAPAASYRDENDLMGFVEDQFVPFSAEPEFARHNIVTSFSHLFAGGYAAGYYSYLWSEVLDADAFTRFKEAGIFDRETGRDFMRTILTRGDSDDPEALFREFMGRDPDPEALFERNLGPGLEQVSA